MAANEVAEGATQGGCLCGAVRYTLEKPAHHVSLCHCGMCRRQTGGPVMALHGVGAVAVSDAEGMLRWYGSSDWGERGFCSRCGSNLMWRMKETGETLPAAGSLDSAAGLVIASHVFVDDKPGFYEFADDTPRLTSAEAEAMFTGAQQG
ncbi:GFA family protein [Rubrimonas cliftonensis]|uniref:Uncharacterized conserved protein n=1 Tax=Rubrimonas cliftonensis TaxID=89524 RepID=A0A1H4EY31_9RHOB|nr:GFA family protein [Rubrimonas cliftonensis]SEA89172.1 Uncharacterized conserved protein [Rubrimonas cliftonensis]